MLKFLIHLEDRKSSYYMIVGQATWDWIDCGCPTFTPGCYSIEERVPDAVVAEALAAGGQDSDGFDLHVTVTSGSFDNDRAIHCLRMFKTYDDLPYDELGAKPGGTYNGCLY